MLNSESFSQGLVRVEICSSLGGGFLTILIHKDEGPEKLKEQVLLKIKKKRHQLDKRGSESLEPSDYQLLEGMTQVRENLQKGETSPVLTTTKYRLVDTKLDNEEKIRWVPNDERDNCAICDSKFGFVKRKHHCRKCGEVVCSSCLRQIQIPKYDKPQPVCLYCCKSGGNSKNNKSKISGPKNDQIDVTDAVLEVMKLKGHFVPLPSDGSEQKAGFLIRREVTRSGKGFTWRRRYFVLIEHCDSLTFSGAALQCFEGKSQAESNSPPLEMLPLAGAKAYWYERGFFPRVKNAFHLGIKAKGVVEALVLECDSEQGRIEWLGSLLASGVSDEGMQRTPRISDKHVKEGYLEKMGKKEKQSGLKGGWKPRYFILDYNPNRLEYFITKDDAVNKKPKGSITLDVDTMVASVKGTFLGNQYCFSITPHGGSRRFVLSAADEKDLKEWMDVIEEVRMQRTVYIRQKEQNENLMRGAIKKQRDREMREKQLKDIERTNKRREQRQKKLDQEFHAKLTQLSEEKQSVQELKLALEEERKKMLDGVEQAREKLQNAIKNEKERIHDLKHEVERLHVLQKEEKRRIKVLRRIARKEQAIVDQEKMEFKKAKDEHEHEAKKVSELYALVQQESKTKKEISEDLAKRERDIRTREQELTLREAERAQKDQLLEEFHYVLNVDS